MELLKLPKHVKYEILSRVYPGNFAQTCQQSYNLIFDEEFWQFCIVKIKGSYVFEKPEYLTYRQFYYNIINSVKLYDIHEFTLFIADNVIFYHNNHYITNKNELYDEFNDLIQTGIKQYYTDVCYIKNAPTYCNLMLNNKGQLITLINKKKLL